MATITRQLFQFFDDQGVAEADLLYDDVSLAVSAVTLTNNTGKAITITVTDPVTSAVVFTAARSQQGTQSFNLTSRHLSMVPGTGAHGQATLSPPFNVTGGWG